MSKCNRLTAGKEFDVIITTVKLFDLTCLFMLIRLYEYEIGFKK